MRQVLLIRHAHAADPDTAGSDARRPLTARGREQFRRIADSILEHGPVPERIYHSPLLRAVETAELLHRAAGLPPSELREASWLAPGSSFANFASAVERDVAEAIAVVGHEPMISLWTAKLLGSARLPFSPGSVAALEFDERIASGTGRLLYFLDSSQFGG